MPFTVRRLPELSKAEAAGLPIAAVTVLQALKAAGTKFDGTDEPSNVLITAASGGVGHHVFQLSRLRLLCLQKGDLQEEAGAIAISTKGGLAVPGGIGEGREDRDSGGFKTSFEQSRGGLG